MHNSRLQEIKKRFTYLTLRLGRANGKMRFQEDINWLVEQADKVEQYKEEIIELRGKLHLSCPKCHEDCASWIVDGKPCSDNW